MHADVESTDRTTGDYVLFGLTFASSLSFVYGIVIAAPVLALISFLLSLLFVLLSSSG